MVAHPVFLCLLFQLEMEPGSKLNLTFTNDRTSSAVRHAKVYASIIRGKVKACLPSWTSPASREGIQGRIYACHLVAVKEIKGFGQNLEIGRFSKSEPT